MMTSNNFLTSYREVLTEEVQNVHLAVFQQGATSRATWNSSALGVVFAPLSQIQPTFGISHVISYTFAIEGQEIKKYFVSRYTAVSYAFRKKAHIPGSPHIHDTKYFS